MGVSWEFVAVIVSIIGGFSTVILFSVRIMLLGHRGHVESMIRNISININDGANEFKRLEHDLMNLKVGLTERFVLREDWIRFASVIDAKQDSLGDKLALTNERFERFLERMNLHD